MKLCLQELNSSSCFCSFSCLLFPLPFPFNASQPPSTAQLFFPMLWLKLPPVSFVLYQEYFVPGSKGKMQLLDAALWNPCWEVLFPYNTSLPKEGSGNGTHTSSVPWQAMASLGLGWCPLFVHPLDLFSFIHMLGNCKDFMRAITNNTSQEEVPERPMFFPIWEVCILSFCLQILYISLAFLFFVLLRRHILNSQQDLSLWYSRVTATDKVSIESSVFKLSAIFSILFSFSP